MSRMNVQYLDVAADDLKVELTQCKEEGRDIGPLVGRFEALLGADFADPAVRDQAAALLDESIRLPMRSDYQYVEPSDLEGIQAARPAQTLEPRQVGADLASRVHGAWLGRCAGCLLGKPVEGWRTDKLWPMLKESGQWPLSDYISRDVDQELVARYKLAPSRSWRQDIRLMPEDDDLNYTLTGLAIMNAHGRDFTPEHVARFWLNELPLLHTYTAERVAYRNFLLLMAPPASASYRNPYREWIGAQIRGDFFGYASPGQPARAAGWAFRDACISHVKNGIYGEMWVAAMLAWALVSNDVREVIQAGLEQIPSKSRVAEAVSEVMSWPGQGVGYDEAVVRIHRRWDEHTPHGWCHTISNAMIVTAALVYGQGDFGLSICRAVQPGFDTDCNGATVGSIIGAMHGSSAMPGKWTVPLNDTLESGLSGYRVNSISDLAGRTLRLIEALR